MSRSTTADLNSALAIAKDVKRIQREIREKHNEYVGRVMETEEAIEKSLKPLSEPLKRFYFGAAAAAGQIKKEEPLSPKVEDVWGEDIEDVFRDDTSKASSERSSSVRSDRGNASIMNESIAGIMQEVSHLKDREAQEYFHKVITDPKKEIDNTYGLHYDSDNNTWMLGEQTVNIDEDSLLVGGVRYPYTKGFFELLFMKEPDTKTVVENDMTEYKKVLSQTGVHRNRLGHVKSNISKKYKTIISKIFPPKSTGESASSSGTGLLRHWTEAVDYKHWDDPNELVSRLRLLLMSRTAGHTGHNNEIQSILEELREAKLIAGRMKKV
jgi:hypothetical protein